MEEDNRISGNTAELSKTEALVISLEEAFTKLGSFETEQTRLAGEVERSTAEEAATLQDLSLTESQAIKKVAETMARKSVFTARHAAAVTRTKEQVGSILEIGADVRRRISILIQRLQINRKERALQMLAEIFPRYLHHLPTPVRRDDLARSTNICSEVFNLEGRISQIQHHIPDFELADLRNSRGWYDEVSALCRSEPNLDLTKDFGKKQEPIKADAQPAVDAEAHAIAA
jgi:hypothetical protein